MARTLFYLCSTLLLIILLPSCNKTYDTFDDVIDAGGGFKEPTANESVKSSMTTDSLINGQKWVCTTETNDIMAKGGGKEGFPLFSPNAGIIYPGSLLQGKSLSKATPDPIAVNRAGGTISTDILDGNNFASITVPEVGKGAVIQAINDIIAQSTGIIPANFSFHYKSIQSREEFALDLRVNVETAATEIEGKLNLDFSKSVNRYYVKLEQSFYTMSFDIPRSYDDIFTSDVTPQQLARYVGPGNPACYVSDVTYGRLFYMIIESTSSKAEMDLAISGSFNGIVTKVDGDLAINYMKKLKNLNISVFAFGGESESTFNAIGLSNINELKTVLGAAADIRSGKALSYVVKSVYDNRTVAVQLATKYDVVNCIPGQDDNAPAISRHWPGLSSKLGIVGAAFMDSNNKIYLINAQGDKYMTSDIGVLEGPFPVAGLGVGQMPFPKIGAACNIEGNTWDSPTIMLFDESGTRYTYLLAGVGSEWKNASSLYDYSNGTCPFNTSGIGAMQFSFKDPNGPSRRYFINSEGSKSVEFNNNPQSWGSITNTNASALKFQYIGAGLGFYLGNDRIFYYFDKEKAQYSVYGNLDGTGNKTIGPFQY